MAVNEEARARRYEWRAGMLRFDPDDERKARDAAVFEKAARLVRRIGELRPAFEAASDRLAADHYKALGAWYKGRAGDKPVLADAMWSDRDVLEFRAARQDWADYMRTDEYRGAVDRSKITNDWAEPSDAELLKGKG